MSAIDLGAGNGGVEIANHRSNLGRARRRGFQREHVDALEIELAAVQGDVSALPLNSRGIGHCK